MPLSPLQSAFGQPQVKRKPVREKGPLESQVSIGPNNAYGARIGERIGSDVSAPLPAVGAYARSARLKDIANSGGSEAMFAQNALAGKGPPPIPGLPNGEQYTGQPLESLKGQLNLPRLGVNNPNQRSGSAADSQTIAINRLRSGVSLNPDERLIVDGMKSKDPQSLKDALAGSVSQRKADAQEVLRQRGLERGDATAAARNYAKMTRPRNVMLGTGQTVSQPGMPAGVAAVRTMGGGATPLNLALSGNLNPNAAAGFNETAARERSGLAENASREKQAMIGALTVQSQSEIPEVAKEAQRRLSEMNRGNAPAVASSPIVQGETAMPKADTAMSQEGQVSDSYLREFATRIPEGTPPDKIREMALQQGIPLSQLEDYIYGLENPGLVQQATAAPIDMSLRQPWMGGGALADWLKPATSAVEKMLPFSSGAQRKITEGKSLAQRLRGK